MSANDKGSEKLELCGKRKFISTNEMVTTVNIEVMKAFIHHGPFQDVNNENIATVVTKRIYILANRCTLEMMSSMLQSLLI